MPSGKDYANRLQEETRRTLAGWIHNIETELNGIKSSLSASASRMGQNLSLIREIQVPGLESMIGQLMSETNRDSAAARSDEMGFLAHFAHDMRKKETQEEILQLLLERAYRYAPRLALFVTRNHQFCGWSSRGFAETSASAISTCAIASEKSSFLCTALEADGLTTVPDFSAEEALAHLVADGRTGPWHAFPLKAIGRPVAILLAAPGKDRSCDLESLCILMDVTGLCVENMALKVLQELKTNKSSVPVEIRGAAPLQAPVIAIAEAPLPEPAPQAPQAAPALEAEAAIAESAESAAAVAPAVAEPEPQPEPEIELKMAAASSAVSDICPPAAEPEPIPEPPATSEAVPVEEPVQEPAKIEIAQPVDAPPAEENHVPAAAAKEPSKASALREVQPLSEEEKLHADAKRFARLLASEIKLYNEQRVLEGRQNRDVYVRLKRDIDRSRDMYEKRVSPLVARKVDYFHDEVIRVLGDNDPSTLGSDYPGPRVES